jgi:hypothetical protein
MLSSKNWVKSCTRPPPPQATVLELHGALATKGERNCHDCRCTTNIHAKRKATVASRSRRQRVLAETHNPHPTVPHARGVNASPPT